MVDGLDGLTRVDERLPTDCAVLVNTSALESSAFSAPTGFSG